MAVVYVPSSQHRVEAYYGFRAIILRLLDLVCTPRRASFTRQWNAWYTDARNYRNNTRRI